MGTIKHISIFAIAIMLASTTASAESRHGNGGSGNSFGNSNGNSNGNNNNNNQFSNSIGSFGGGGGGAGGGSGSGGNESKPSKELESLSKDLPEQLKKNQEVADKGLETMKKSAETGQQALSKVMENAAKTAQDGENNKEFQKAISQITASLSANSAADAAASLKFTDDVNKSSQAMAAATIENNKKILNMLTNGNQQAAPVNNDNLLTQTNPNRENPLAAAIQATSEKSSAVPALAKGTAISHGGGGNSFIEKNAYNAPALNR